MSTRSVTLVFVIVFLLAGASGFMPVMLYPVPADAPPLSMAMGYGLVVGLVPVNLLHNFLHVLFGLLGVAAYAGLFAPRAYVRMVAVSYSLLVILGLVPATNTLFGLMPIYGYAIWLHLVLGVVAVQFGFLNFAEAPDRRK